MADTSGLESLKKALENIRSREGGEKRREQFAIAADLVDKLAPSCNLSIAKLVRGLPKVDDLFRSLSEPQKKEAMVGLAMMEDPSLDVTAITLDYINRQAAKEPVLIASRIESFDMALRMTSQPEEVASSITSGILLLFVREALFDYYRAGKYKPVSPTSGPEPSVN